MACHWQPTAFWRRLVLAFLVFTQTGVATWAMLATLPYHGGTWLERAIVLLFALLFLWLSAGFWIALTGFVMRLRGGDPFAPGARFAVTDAPLPLDARIAVVYPVYHEDVQRTLAGLRATWLDLARTGEIARFDFFVLSDSRDPEIWLQEREACHHLAVLLGARGRVHYRRRPLNLNRKTGNVADFLRRWGRDFRYLIVMDADSVMAGETLVRMAQLMEVQPRIGILQTAPTLINAVSPHARVQQFASQLYGPLFTAGLAALQLGDAVFWGHNAIIRTDAFMRHCGLPRLRGAGFLSGSVLSHDFVEAAYLCRAGYEIWLDPTLSGSHEESPPTLDDELARDRRWAHGNLQHLYFLFRRGFTMAHRIAFANGIMAYLSSLLWFLYIVFITIELARFTLWPIEYFPEPYSLFPSWPELRPGWALGLAASVLFVLFLPKLLAVAELLWTPVRRREFGGMRQIFGSLLLESLVSMLLAPIRMLAHTRHVLTTLLNIEVRWAGQNRTDEISWWQAWRLHGPGCVLALGWSGFAWWVQPMFFYWSLPIAVPLVLAAPLSVWLSRFEAGQALRRRGLLCTAGEVMPTAVIRDLQEAPELVANGPLGVFESVVLDPARNHFHQMLARVRSDHPGRALRRLALIKRCCEAGPQALSRNDKTWLLEDREALAALHHAVWQCRPGSPWAALVARFCTSP
jgi:membrane glycosyltransferase